MAAGCGWGEPAGSKRATWIARACKSESRRAKDARTATPCSRRGCWRSCATTTACSIPKSGSSLGANRINAMPSATGQKIFYLARERAKLPDKGGIHSLRHSFATHLIESGVEITVVQRLLGHASLSTTSVYLHVRQERLAQIQSPLQLLQLSQKSTRLNS